VTGGGCAPFQKKWLPWVALSPQGSSPREPAFVPGGGKSAETKGTEGGGTVLGAGRVGDRGGEKGPTQRGAE